LTSATVAQKTREIVFIGKVKKYDRTERNNFFMQRMFSRPVFLRDMF